MSSPGQFPRAAGFLLATLLLLAACNQQSRAAATAAPASPTKEQPAMSDAATSPDRQGSLNVKVGDTAPEVELPMFPEGTFKLSDYRGKQAVVFYFYPMDDTPGCTKEACTFRDTHDDFAHAGAAIFGVSADSLESHKLFADKFHLPFPLLVDDGGKVRHEFGMPDPLAPLHARVTYIIDKQGVVRHIIGAEPDKIDVEEHITQALDWVKRLQAEDHAQ